MPRQYDPDEYDADVAELRAQVRAERRGFRQLIAHPDPRDPDCPDTDDEEESDE